MWSVDTPLAKASDANDAVMTMTRDVRCRIMHTVGMRPAETGGILLGPVDRNIVTDFYFDTRGECSGGTYSPDIVTMKRLMKEEWLPSGRHLKGFTHSHPGSFDRLSAGDMKYLARLLELNPDMDRFFSPIVIPHQFRIRPIIVFRGDVNVQVFARLRLID